MRDLAAGAGVSPATLYAYFATKEELFATLYVEAIEAHTVKVERLAEQGHDLVSLLAALLEEYLDLYRTYGRHFTLWSALRADRRASTGPFPAELVAALREATVAHARVQMAAIEASAETDGRQVADEVLVPTFVWATLNGLADHLTSERRGLDRFPPRQLIRFSAERLALAITDPAD